MVEHRLLYHESGSKQYEDDIDRIVLTRHLFANVYISNQIWVTSRIDETL